mgnify:CR=1 FL=1
MRDPPQWVDMVRFIHTADLQLGMTRRFLDADAQARYAQARIDALVSIGALATASVLMLLPYFAYVFHFLGPDQVVERIRFNTNRVIARAVAYRGADLDEQKRLAGAGIEQLADMALNAVEKKDKAMFDTEAKRIVNALDAGTAKLKAAAAVR